MRLRTLLFSIVIFSSVWAGGGASKRSNAAAVSPLGRDVERVERLLRETQDLLHYGAFATALEKAQEAFDAAESLSDRRLAARALGLSGSARDRLGEHSLAGQLHEQALRLARETPDRAVEAAVLAEMGSACWRRSDYSRALDYCRQAAAIQEEIGDQEGLARTLMYIGRVHFKQSSYEQALEHHRRALTIQEAIGDRRGQSVTLEDLGDTLQEQGAYAQALEHYERSLRAREQLGDRAGQSYMLTILGRRFLIEGSYRDALGYVTRALELAEEIGDLASRASALHHMGIIQSRRGVYDEAMACYERALPDYVTLKDRREQAWVLSRMADVRHRQRDFRAALTAYGQAVQIWEEIRDPRGLAGGLERSGRAWEELGDDDRALALYERARKLREESQPAFLPPILTSIGRISARRGERERALEYGRHALELARQSRNAEVLWRAAHDLGRIERDLGMRAEALESFRESMGVIERLRVGAIAQDEAKAGFLDARQVVYSDTIHLLMEMGKAAEALEVAERARARAFLDLLGGRELEAKPSDSESLSRVRKLEKELRRQASHPAPAGSQARREAERGEDPVGADRRRFQAEDSELASLVMVQAPKLRELREEARRRHSTLVEYFAAEDRLFIWVVAPGREIRGAVSRIERGELENLVRRMRRAMRTGAATGRGEVDVELAERGSAAPAPERSKAEEPDPLPLLRDLHRLLVEPIDAWLPQDPDELVTIVPHGPLFLVPFAALLDGRGRYLLERHTIHYTPAISVLEYTEKKRRRVSAGAPQLLLVGNPSMPWIPGRQRPLPPLPGAEAEALAIARLYPRKQVTTLIGARAEEPLVRKLAPGQTIIHLATHAVISDEEPLGSLVALAPALSARTAGTEMAVSGRRREPESDGLLTVREVFALDLHANLVTLSACNTALGKVSGDGVVGLSRAFIYAGTPTVMASLWRVSDQVAKFQMERFYGALAQNGGNKAAALRKAQLETLRRLREKRFRTSSGRVLPEHPIFWAPFVIVGEAGEHRPA